MQDEECVYQTVNYMPFFVHSKFLSKDYIILAAVIGGMEMFQNRFAENFSKMPVFLK